MGVCYTEELPANAKRKVLRRPKPMLLRADSIPGRLSMEDYCSRPHAMVSFAGDLNGYIDEELALHGCKRKVVLAVPQFNGLASLLAGTDIIATVPDYAAAALAANGGVRAEPCPSRPARLELSMAGAAPRHDPAERWLRSRIQMFVGDPDSLWVENGAAFSTRIHTTHTARDSSALPWRLLLPTGIALDWWERPAAVIHPADITWA